MIVFDLFFFAFFLFDTGFSLDNAVIFISLSSAALSSLSSFSLGSLLGDLGKEVRALALLDVGVSSDRWCALVMSLGVLQVLPLGDLIELSLAVDLLYVDVVCQGKTSFKNEF